VQNDVYNPGACRGEPTLSGAGDGAVQRHPDRPAGPQTKTRSAPAWAGNTAFMRAR